jgi:hypothetical protein
MIRRSRLLLLARSEGGCLMVYEKREWLLGLEDDERKLPATEDLIDGVRQQRVGIWM